MEQYIELNVRNALAAICTGLLCALIYEWLQDPYTIILMGILMYFWFAYIFGKPEETNTIPDPFVENTPKFKRRTMKRDFIHWDDLEEE